MRSFTKVKINGLRDLALTNFLPDVSPLLFYNDLSSINTELLDDENEALSTLIKGVAIPAGMENLSSANVYAQGYSYGILCRPIIKPKVEWEKVMRIIESHWKPNVDANVDPFTVSSVSSVSTEESEFMYSIFAKGFHSGYHFRDASK